MGMLSIWEYIIRVYMNLYNVHIHIYIIYVLYILLLLFIIIYYYYYLLLLLYVPCVYPLILFDL